MNREQRKFALETLAAILNKKLAKVKVEYADKREAVPAITETYAKVLAKDKAEQKLVLDALLEKLRTGYVGILLNVNSIDSEVDTPKLKPIREAYRAQLRQLCDEENAKKEALMAKGEELRRQIMLGDLPPQALALLTDFEAEEV